jgi:hypothetical protein
MQFEKNKKLWSDFKCIIQSINLKNNKHVINIHHPNHVLLVYPNVHQWLQMWSPIDIYAWT